MNAFAKDEQSRARRLVRRRTEPDSDGFITVSRGGRTGPSHKQEADDALRKQQKKDDERAQNLKSFQFYRFQTREMNKARADQLVKAFEKDKQEARALKGAEEAHVSIP